MRRTAAEQLIKDLSRQGVTIADPRGITKEEWLKRSCNKAEKWTTKYLLAPNPVFPLEDLTYAYWYMLTTLVEPKKSTVGVVSIMAFREFDELITHDMWQHDMLAMIPNSPPWEDEEDPAPRFARNASRKQREQTRKHKQAAWGTDSLDDPALIGYLSKAITSGERHEKYADVAVRQVELANTGYLPNRIPDLLVAGVARQQLIDKAVFGIDSQPMSAVEEKDVRRIGGLFQVEAWWETARRAVERRSLQEIVGVARDTFPAVAIECMLEEENPLVSSVELRAMRSALQLFTMADDDLREHCRRIRIHGKRRGIETPTYIRQLP